MPIACSALGCTNRFVKGSEIRFYRFPISKPQLAEQWVRSLGRKNFVPTTNSCLCSEHFLPDCFRDYNGKQFLREDAVPTIFAHTREGADGTKIELRKNRGGLVMKEESRSGSISDGGKQQFTKDKRQVSKDTGQKVKTGNDAFKRRGGAKVPPSD
ncbi:ARL14 effector protein, partial [Clarias magur]